MSDLVQRLRDSATQARALDRAALLNEAADEIERLRITDAERLSIQWVIGEALSVDGVSIQATLRGLLERLQ